MRDASNRRESGHSIVDGSMEIGRAVDAGIAIDCIYFAEAEREVEEELISAVGLERLQPVSAAVMRKLAYGERDSGLVAVAKTPTLGIERLKLPSKPLLLVLDGIEKPGNLGACLRTAAATGVDAVLLSNPICDVFNPNAIRSSRGTIFSMPLAVATIDEVVGLCAELQVELFTARVDASTEFWQADFCGGAALVLGNEANGLNNLWSGPQFTPLTIPMRDATDSLNVSISAAVMLYEAVRQRRGTQEIGSQHTKLR